MKRKDLFISDANSYSLFPTVCVSVNDPISVAVELYRPNSNNGIGLYCIELPWCLSGDDALFSPALVDMIDGSLFPPGSPLNPPLDVTPQDNFYAAVVAHVLTDLCYDWEQGYSWALYQLSGAWGQRKLASFADNELDPSWHIREVNAFLDADFGPCLSGLTVTGMDDFLFFAEMMDMASTMREVDSKYHAEIRTTIDRLEEMFRRRKAVLSQKPISRTTRELFDARAPGPWWVTLGKNNPVVEGT